MKPSLRLRLRDLRRLPLKPVLADQQTEYHTCLILLASRVFGRLFDVAGENGAVSSGDPPLVYLIRDDLLDQVFQA